jgi:hypothetical protein
MTTTRMNKKLSDYQVDVIVSAPAISRGFPWECACGEMHRSFESARMCRKCQRYLVDYNNRSAPIDLRKLLGLHNRD